MPAENETIETSFDEMRMEDSERIVGQLFGEVEPPKKADEEDNADDQSDDQSSEDSEDSEDQTSDDTDDFDWDDDDESQTSDKKDDTEDDSDKEEDPPNETVARKLAKENGRKAKMLEAKIHEKDLELARLQKERDEFASRMQEYEATQMRPEDFPEYRTVHDEIIVDVTESADLLPISDPTLVRKSFGTMIDAFMKMSSKSGEDRVAERENLRAQIAESLKLTDLPYTELDDEEKRALAPAITDVMKMLQRNVGKVRELQSLHKSLSERAKTGTLAVGVREYQSAVETFRPILETVGDVADDVIEADPHSVPSIVAKMVRTTPEAKRRLDRAKEDLLEIIVGPRALTQDEIDKLNQQGVDLREFSAQRKRAREEKIKKMLPLLVQGLIARPMLKELSKKASQVSKTVDKEDVEFDALSETMKAKTGKPRPAAPLPASQRPNPLDKLFGGGWDDDV